MIDGIASLRAFDKGPHPLWIQNVERRIGTRAMRVLEEIDRPQPVIDLLLIGHVVPFREADAATSSEAFLWEAAGGSFRQDATAQGFADLRTVPTPMAASGAYDEG